jgi:hypothetical protein
MFHFEAYSPQIPHLVGMEDFVQWDTAQGRRAGENTGSPDTKR